MLFFQSQSIDMFLIAPWKHTLWILLSRPMKMTVRLALRPLTLISEAKKKTCKLNHSDGTRMRARGNQLVEVMQRKNCQANADTQTLLFFKSLLRFGLIPSPKTQISLRIRTVWLESLLSVWRKVCILGYQNAPSEDFEQTVRMRRLIWIFARRTCPKVRFLTLGLKLFPA